jgi:PKD repeat protein
MSDLSGNEVQDISIDFMVDAAWLQDTGVAAEDIRLYVYDNGWKELETTKNNGLTYNAKTAVFGFFAISGLIPADEQPLPQASFTADSIAALKVSFTDTSTDAVSYSWDFGDGATSVQASPVHTYANPGTYTVTLTVSNDAGQDTMEMEINVPGSEDDTGFGIPFMNPVVVFVMFLTAAGLIRRRRGL